MTSSASWIPRAAATSCGGSRVAAGVRDHDGARGPRSRAPGPRDVLGGGRGHRWRHVDARAGSDGCAGMTTSRRRPMQRLGDLIPDAARRLGLDEELRLARAIATWGAIVAERVPAAAGSTRPVRIDDFALVVEADAPIVGQELRGFGRRSCSRRSGRRRAGCRRASSGSRSAGASAQSRAASARVRQQPLFAAGRARSAAFRAAPAGCRAPSGLPRPSRCSCHNRRLPVASGPHHQAPGPSTHRPLRSRPCRVFRRPASPAR